MENQNNNYEIELETKYESVEPSEIIQDSGEPIFENVTDNNVSEETKPKIIFSGKDCVFAWLCFLAGYAISRAIPVDVNPLGGLIFIVVLFAVTAGFLLAKGFKLTFAPILSAVTAVVLSFSLVLTNDSTLGSWAFFFGIVLYMYFVYSATGNYIEKVFSNFLAGDFFRALFILPFRSFGDIFRAAFSNKNSGGMKVVGKVILGLAVAIIPTAIVILLLSYDSDFNNLMADIFDFNIGDIFSHIGSIIVGVPLGMYAFGLYSSAVNKKCENVASAEGFKMAGAACRFAPALTVCAATLPLLFVYCVFFVSQWKYYVSGFTGVLPEEFSYAEYAREGFFQLCAVSVINLVIIIAVSLFIKRKQEKSPAVLKIVSVLYALSTLVLVSTAIAKMVMYIDNYGLTRKRVFSSVFMIALAIVFILITVKQFVFKFKVVPISVVLCALLFAVMSLSNVNGLIMRYNVDHYLDGSLPKVDIHASNDLGVSAVESLVDLALELDERYGGDITSDRCIEADEETEAMYWLLQRRLKNAAAELGDDEKSAFSFNIPELKARAALEKVGFDF